MGYRIGVCGLHFGTSFAELFHAHPLVDEVVLCDLMPERLKATQEKLRIASTCASFDELIEMDVDAVGIYTQRWTHAPLAIRALKAGKHVYSAVPAAITLEELAELVRTVEETGLTYMLGETSFYRPQTIWCRERFAEGVFGAFVYGEGQYHHNMAHGFYPPFYLANGPEWKKFASVPPMLYPTHSVCHVLGVTLSRFTKASCFGWVDRHEDGIFRKELSRWGNEFSNQSALFQSADGGMARINEFRRTAAGESRQSIIGTLASWEEQVNPYKQAVSVKQQFEGKEGRGPDSAASNAVFSRVTWTREPKKPDGSYDFEQASEYYHLVSEDATHIHRADGIEITEANCERLNLTRDFVGRKHLNVSAAHHVERLPKEFVGLNNGHCGSHQFLVDDFVKAMDSGRLPPNHVWLAARYNAPGIVAHESSMKGGALLAIPDFGRPPKDATYLDPLSVLRD